MSVREKIPNTNYWYEYIIFEEDHLIDYELYLSEDADDYLGICRVYTAYDSYTNTEYFESCEVLESCENLSDKDFKELIRSVI